MDEVKGHSKLHDVRETKKCSEMMDRANMKLRNVIQKRKFEFNPKNRQN